MGKYGQAAIIATTLLNTNKMDSPLEAWNQATIEIFGEGTSSQIKGCPRGAFLGLCEEGLVNGIKEGNYTLKNPFNNREYAIKAVDLIKNDPSLANDVKQLWNKVTAGENKVHNSQMDVVVMLWKNKLIEQ